MINEHFDHQILFRENEILHFMGQYYTTFGFSNNL